MNVLSQFKLNNKTAIVTGAARGLGESMAESLASVGVNVVIADINIEGATKVANRIQKSGVKTLATEVDITKKEQVKSMFKQVINNFNKIDILINNAGICINEAAKKMSNDNWNKVIDVNLNGMFLCSKEAGNVMLNQGFGNIINIASMSGIIVNRPQPQAAYNASKAGVIHLTKSLAAEWAPNIRVNAIAPGYMKTEMTKKYLKDNPSIKKEWLNYTPLKRMGEINEINGAVIFLSSEASSFMTGQTMVIDGGYCIY